MLRSARVLWIWLLVLALPVQAVTAATMAYCGPGHLPGPVGTASHDLRADHDHSGHGQAQGPGEHAGHGAVHAHPHADDSGAPSLPPASGSAPVTEAWLAHADDHECSACASCCSAAAIPSIGMQLPVPEHPPTVFVAVVPAVEKFAAAGPDRPPRLRHA
jgi:hypothetical protein